jgi:hypothetical protein
LWSNLPQEPAEATVEKQPGQEVTAFLKEWATGDRAALGRPAFETGSVPLSF